LIAMALVSAYPEDLHSLLTCLIPKPFTSQVLLLKQWGLLRSTVRCPHDDCHTPTTVIAPISDFEGEITRHTPCAKASCRRNHQYHRSVFYRGGSLAGEFVQLSLLTLAQIVMCFALGVSAKTTHSLMYTQCSDFQVHHVYRNLRERIKRDNDQQLRDKRLGGIYAFGSEETRQCVTQLAGGPIGAPGSTPVASAVVEFDEGQCRNAIQVVMTQSMKNLCTYLLNICIKLHIHKKHMLPCHLRESRLHKV
jgi:hypothetical protein